MQSIFLQVETAGKAAQVAARATDQLIKSADQESFLVQLLFWLVLLFGGMLFLLGYGVIRHLLKRTATLEKENEQKDIINRLTNQNNAV